MSGDQPLPDRSPLYDAITTVLSCALQNDNQVQKLAYEHKKKLEAVEEFPEVICEIIGSEEEALSERQLAATFLKVYLEELYFQKRVNGIFFNSNMGKRIAVQLLNYLNSIHGNLKPMVSYNVALFLALGYWDTLTIQLNDMIKSENPDSIHNGVFVLAQAIDKTFFEGQDNYVVEEHWFDVLLGVFKMTNVPSVTRVFTIHPMFVMMKYVKPHQNYISDCWTKLSEEFEKALNEPYSVSSDFQLKGEILRCLNDSTDEFLEYCHIFIPCSLPAIGNLLTICCEQYKKIIRCSQRAPKDASEPEHESPTNFFDLISSILELIYSLLDMNYFDVLIEDLDNLLYCVFAFMACHGDMERYAFIDLVEKDNNWTIRDLCSQIIVFATSKIESRLPNGKAMFFKSLHNVFQRFTNELDSETPQVSMSLLFYSTRITESMMFGLGLVEERYSATDPEFVFPLDYYLTLWTGKYIRADTMARGRILWLGGVYSMELSPTLLDVHIKAVLENLNEEIRYFLVPCAQALCNYLKTFKKESPEKKFIISSLAKDIMACLINVARKARQFPLHHSLNALGYFVKLWQPNQMSGSSDILALKQPFNKMELLHKRIAANNIDEIEDILIRTVSCHYSDIFIMKEVNFLVAKLAQSNSFKILIHDKFLTWLLQVIHNLEPKHMRHDPDKAVDILNTYSVYATTMDDYFILQIFMGAARLLNANSDRDVELDVSAANLLTTLLIKVPNQLKFIQQMPKGIPVMGEFPQLLEGLLEPAKTIPGEVLGKLVVAAIFSLPELMEPHFETILRNVITGICKNHQNLRGNWLIFICICMIRTSDTLSYLSVLPGPHGGSALNFIMKKWMIEFIPQLETIERKIIVLSLTQIIQNCLENENDYPKMEEVCISFDQKPNEESPTGEIFNGVEYMYYLLVEFLFYEDKLQKIKSPPTPPYDFSDFGEDMNTRSEEDSLVLFHNHPFNIDVVSHIVSFLKTGYEPYFNIVRKFVSSTNYFRLRDLGCNVPEINIHEDME